jgi:hypothetical protein
MKELLGPLISFFFENFYSAVVVGRGYAKEREFLFCCCGRCVWLGYMKELLGPYFSGGLVWKSQNGKNYRAKIHFLFNFE